MQRGTKEFYEMRDAFERFATKSPHVRVRLDRCTGSDAPKSNFYESGETNALFHTFMAGYANARAVYLETTP